MCGQKRTGLKDWAMEEDNRISIGIRGMAEVVNIAIWAEAAHDFGARSGINGMALRANGDFAVIADADAVLLAPDKGPPRASGDGTQDGTLFSESLLFGGVWRGSQFPMDFVLVDVRQQLVQELVGPFKFDDVIGGQEGWKAFLPVIMAAFDFALGLRSGGITKGHAVEVQRGAELGEGIRGVGEEEGMVVHIESQGQAIGLEGTGQEVEVSQEGFGVIEAGSDIVAGGIVQQIEEDLLVGGVGQEGMWGGVILPEGPQVADLPAFDRFGRGFEASIWGQLVFDGPAADTGAVGFEVEAAVEFAGGGAIGGGRLGGQELGQKGGYWLRPGGVMVAAGKAGRPSSGVVLDTGLKVIGVEFVEASASQSQFLGGLASGELPAAIVGQEVTNQRGGQAFDEWLLFTPTGCQRKVDFSLWN